MRYFIVCVLAIVLSTRIYGQDRGLAIDKPSAAQEAAAGTTYALIVGISNYQYFTPLKYADKDAELFRNYVRSKPGGSVTDEHILYLINEEAKGGTLNTRALAWIENRPYVAGDKLYVYLAGHGDAIDEDEYFFLGADLAVGSDGAKNNYRAGFALQMYNLKMSIKRAAAKGVQVVLIMDACRTNELAGGQEGQKLFTTGIMKSEVNGIMMLAAGPGQSAVENAQVGGGHGLFSWYLVDGLSGEADKDESGKIDMYELSSYVKDKVRGDAMKLFKHQQSPEFSGFKDDSKVISVVDAAYYASWKNDKKLTNAVSSSPAVAAAGKREAVANNDAELVSTYNLFTGAIKENRLTGDRSAAAYYKSMVAHAPSAPLTEDAKYTLAGEYLNYAQGKINIYLQGKDEASEVVYAQAVSDNNSGNTPTKYKLVAIVPYRMAADMVDSAMVLLQDNKTLLDDLQPKYLFLRAKSFFERKNGGLSYDEAMAAIQKAITLKPADAYLYNVLGNLLLEKQNYGDAMNAYNTAIKLNNSWAYPWNNLGSLYYEQKRYNEAERFYQRAIKIDSTNVDSWNTLGLLFYKQKKYKEAEKMYRKALRIDANSTKTLNNLGVLCCEQNRGPEAEELYKKVVAIDSNDVYAWDGLGYIYHAQKKYTEAEGYYTHAIRIDSAHVNSWNNLGVLYFAQNRYADAERFYKRAITLDSTDVNGWNNLGILFYAQKMYPAAEKNFVKAVELDPQNPNRYYILACLYSMSGDKVNAITYLDLALKNGYINIASLQRNPDLNFIRVTPEFYSLMTTYFPNLR